VFETACGTTAIERVPPDVQAIQLPTEFQGTPERLIIVTVVNDAAPAIRAGSTPRAYAGPMAYATSTSARNTVAALAGDYRLREVSAWPIDPLQVYCVVFEIPADGSRPDLLKRLAADKRVKLAQPMHVFGTLTQSYNDPFVSLQHGFREIDVADAHQWSRGASVRVAIVDTGIDVSHPDLRGRVAMIRNFVDADRGQFERDRHGTEVAGVIAAVANNREGIVGVAPNVKLLAFKACWQLLADKDGARCNSFTLAQALVAAMDEKAQIVNLSLAGPADPLLAALVAQGLKRGMIFVAAVAPTPASESGATDEFPAGATGVLAVDTAEVHERQDGILRAPGREILTLLPGGHYEFASGSSLAAAHVTGTVALLLAQDRHLDPGALHSLLSRTSARTATRGGVVNLINACNALASLVASARCDSEVGTALAAEDVSQLH
jgi:subtilisin family serine protease